MAREVAGEAEFGWRPKFGLPPNWGARGCERWGEFRGCQREVGGRPWGSVTWDYRWRAA